MFKYLIWEIIAAVVGVVAFVILVVHIVKKGNVSKTIKKPGIFIPVILLVVAFFAGLISNRTYAPDFAMPAFMHAHAPGGLPPSIPFHAILDFFIHADDFEKIADISADPNSVPLQPQKPDADGVVRINLKAQEVISEIAPGIYQNYWTYNKQVPGPMLRIREGDTVEITLENDKSSLHDHSIDLHAVNGPGGGSTVTHVAPGEIKTFRFKALNPGLYEYHCAMPNVSTHNSHGQYGLILVDPKDTSIALSKVDKEFYIMQGEFYTKGKLGKRGLMQFDSKALLDGDPNYVVFNGKIETTPRLEAKVGDTVRIYVGNGGVNLISSFHVIGEIFDTVYPEANIGGSIERNVQTTAVLPGGASIVEFKLNAPGNYLLVDHALARMNKGAWAILKADGSEDPSIFESIAAKNEHNHTH
jgi:nitrite reductase (NO-forming)